MQLVKPKIHLAAVAIIAVVIFCGYGLARYRERNKILRSLQEFERRNEWHILVHDGDIQYLDLESASLRFVNIQPTSTPCRIGMGSLNPSGDKVLLPETSCSNNVDSLISVDLVTRERKELLRLPSIEGPRWSPVGSLIAFAGKTDASNPNSDLFVYKPNDGKLSVLANGQLKSEPYPLSWSPDGRRIAFQSTSDQINIISLDGGQFLRIDGGEFPTWSPNGRYIAYRSKATTYTLYDVQTNKKAIILNDGSVDGSLVWSPDSNYVAYSKLSGGVWNWVMGIISVSDTYGDIYTINVQSKLETRLYRHSGSVHPTDWGRILTAPGTTPVVP
jgi:WD40 repeat protein